MTERFDDVVLALLASELEVEIETRRRDGTPRRTIIWVMVDGTDVYLRSVRGPEGRWYRELAAQPEGALHVAGRRVAFRAVPAADERSIAACDEALRRKYRGHPGYDSMFRPHTLETTLRLEPAQA